MSISVLIPTFNRAHLVGQAIESALALPTDSLHEIIVIDDGSTDHTAEIVRAFGPKVKYLHRENGGKSLALNHGRSVLSGRYVYILDDDDLLVSSTLHSARQFLDSNRDIEFVIGQMQDFREESGDRIFQAPRPSTLNVERLHFDLLLGCFISLNCCLMRTNHFLAVGQFDERFIRSQDYDFFLRMTKGARGNFINAPMLSVRQHEGIRGSASINVSVERVRELWQRFDRQIGQKIREDIEEAYFCPPEAEKLRNIERQRLGYIFSALVMATKDLSVYALDDLTKAAELAAPSSATGALLERRLMISLAGVEGFLSSLQDPCGRRRLLRLIRSGAYRESQAHFWRALLWPFKNKLAQGCWKGAAAILLVLTLSPGSAILRGARLKSLEPNYFWKSA